MLQALRDLAVARKEDLVSDEEFICGARRALPFGALVIGGALERCLGEKS